jgi:glutamate/tyrosine decarboxylase-like PLP-dependent enzyme
VPLPGEPADATATAVLADLDEIVGPATMATAGPRFFGFVISGAVPAATVAANVLATAWDQTSSRSDVTPGTARVEAVALRWIALSGRVRDPVALR